MADGQNNVQKAFINLLNAPGLQSEVRARFSGKIMYHSNFGYYQSALLILLDS